MLTVEGAAEGNRKGRPGSLEVKAGPLQTEPGAAPLGASVCEQQGLVGAQKSIQ